jgi:hypothetical protein
MDENPEKSFVDAWIGKNQELLVLFPETPA